MWRCTHCDHSQHRPETAETNDPALHTRGLESYETSFVPRRKYFALITKTYRIMLFTKEIRIFFPPERHTNILNKFCSKNAQFVTIITGGTCSNQCVLKGHQTLTEWATLLCTFKSRMLSSALRSELTIFCPKLKRTEFYF